MAVGTHDDDDDEDWLQELIDYNRKAWVSTCINSCFVWYIVKSMHPITLYIRSTIYRTCQDEPGIHESSRLLSGAGSSRPIAKEYFYVARLDFLNCKSNLKHSETLYPHPVLRRNCLENQTSSSSLVHGLG